MMSIFKPIRIMMKVFKELFFLKQHCERKLIAVEVASYS